MKKITISEKNLPEIFDQIFFNIVKNEYRGYDPYDILNSPFVSNHISGHKSTIALTQLNRFSAVNFRKLLHISKGYNSKAMALILHALLNVDLEKYQKEIEFILEWLLQNKSSDYSQYSIGFTFDIVLDHYTSKKGDASLVISLFAVYAFIEYFRKTNDAKVLEHVNSFHELIEEKLPHFENNYRLWYSYNFHKENEIYNATAKVGKFYALLNELNRDPNLVEKIEKILNYLSAKQRPDGSWAYGEKISYTDGFHTAFVLEAIWYMLIVVDNAKYQDMFRSGLQQYKSRMFKSDGQPLYFHPDYRPSDIRGYLVETDIRDCAMAIVLFAKIGDREQAERVLNWTIQNMYNRKEERVYSYKNKMWTCKINFIRWQAWMLYALSYLNGGGR
jgi:hypothetical protein